MRLADRLGVQFAFPTQTLHIVQEDGDGTGTPAEPPDGKADRRARALGKREARAITAAAEWRREKPPPCVIESTPGPWDDADDGDDTQVESTLGGSA